MELRRYISCSESVNIPSFSSLRQLKQLRKHLLLKASQRHVHRQIIIHDFGQEVDGEAATWPDISCRAEIDDYYQDIFSGTSNMCKWRVSPGPNTPGGVYERIDGLCPKFCMLEHLGIIEENYNDSKFVVKNEWGFFNDEVHNKVHEQCKDLFETVFYAENERCNSVRANDVYDCVQKALLFTVLGQFQCKGQDTTIWPDVSCLDGKQEVDRDTLSQNFNFCVYETSPGPNTPGGEYDDFVNGICPKFCMLEMLNIIEENYGDKNYFVREGEVHRMMHYAFQPETYKKIHEQCNDLFQTVFYKENERCNSPRADEVYDCVQKALC
ncbi:unnamed protein product [Orchesella dallaii]|uniref:Uncharacterized protein n=1 Tax=Orchesella dallaii TaxID=48710 RepID=A0ABP1S3P5_9HEXA